MTELVRYDAMCRAQYIAGLDITARVRESTDRRHVRLIFAPFIEAEGAEGARADQVESLLALAGVEVTDWDRVFIRQSVAAQPNSRAVSGSRCEPIAILQKGDRVFTETQRAGLRGH